MLMNNQIVTRLLVATVVTLAAWLYGAYQHNVISRNSHRALALPRAIAIIFGKVGSDGLVDISGVVLQIFVCIMTPTLVLVSFGKIPPIYGLLIFVGITFFDLAIVLYHEFVRRQGK
jgi:hypothetical protein